MRWNRRSAGTRRPMEWLFKVLMVWAAAGTALALALGIGPGDRGLWWLVGLPFLGLFLLLAVVTASGLLGVLLAWGRRR